MLQRKTTSSQAGWFKKDISFISPRSSCLSKLSHRTSCLCQVGRNLAYFETKACRTTSSEDKNKSTYVVLET